MTENTHAPVADHHISGDRGAHGESTNMARTGRPKLGPAHRDDALLDLMEARARMADLNRKRQEHYRIERDMLTEIDEFLRESSLSWRYGEIVDQQIGTAA